MYLYQFCINIVLEFRRTRMEKTLFLDKYKTARYIFHAIRFLAIYVEHSNGVYIKIHCIQFFAGNPKTQNSS